MNTINIIYNDLKLNFYDIMKLFLINIIYSLNMVIKKYIIDFTFCYASELLFYEGLITLVLFILTLLI